MRPGRKPVGPGVVGRGVAGLGIPSRAGVKEESRGLSGGGEWPFEHSVRTQLLLRRKMQAVVQLDFRCKGEGRFMSPLPAAPFAGLCLVPF